MPSKIIPINNLPEFGIVKDPPRVGLASNVFTDARNMRFRDMAAWKMKGEKALTADLDPTMPTVSGNQHTAGEIVFITWWNNPNLIPSNDTYYIFIIEQKHNTTVVGHRAFLYKASQAATDDHMVDITPTTFTRTVSGTAYTNAGFDAGYTTSGDYKGNWQSTEFAGGFCIIINNGLDKPHHIMDLHGNTTIGNVPKFAALPAWDSYNLQTKILEATVAESFGVAETGTDGDADADKVTPRNIRLFDLGQKVDFTAVTLFVTKQTPNETTTECVPIAAKTNAGSNTPNQGAIDKDFVPGDLPTVATEIGTNPADTNFQYGLYTDIETNTTNIIFNTNIISKDVVRVYLISRKPITNTCGVIRSFGSFLVAGNLKEVTSDGTINEMPGVVRTSDVAVPGSVPQNWNPFAPGVNTADEFVLSDTSTVQDMFELQGNMYIYTNTSIHNLRLTNSLLTPVAFSPVTSQYGCQTTDGLAEFDGKHFVVGSNDIYIFSGNPGNITSVADARVRDYFYKKLNNAAANKLFVLRNQSQDEMWICYPKGTSTKCNEALIYNFRLNNWTIRDLTGIVSGTIAPIIGAGTSDAERPWAADNVNNNKLFPVLAQVCTSGTSNPGKSSILAADVGYKHRSLANAEVNYTSYLEREGLSMTPEFYTEQFHSTALLVQGRGILRLISVSSNAPASCKDVNFEAAVSTSVKKGTLRISSNDTLNNIVGPSYKSDVRLDGRFLNYRIDDADPTTTGAGDFSNNTPSTATPYEWNLVGLQIEVEEGGTR